MSLGTGQRIKTEQYTEERIDNGHQNKEDMIRPRGFWMPDATASALDKIDKTEDQDAIIAKAVSFSISDE
jgi:hypothetical protein